MPASARRHRSPEAIKRLKIQQQQKRINDRLGLTAPSRSASRAAVYELLADSEWHTTTEINAAAISTEGTRRLRELRAEGYEIEGRRMAGSTQHEYRLAH